uniref:Uncharacterized protein n=1 Tax=Lotus japonicus TaxID=34305 RepID=I3SX50_LOTJA|nr:unknown [Lotus japonicus]
MRSRAPPSSLLPFPNPFPLRSILQMISQNAPQMHLLVES